MRHFTIALALGGLLLTGSFAAQADQPADPTVVTDSARQPLTDSSGRQIVASKGWTADSTVVTADSTTVTADSGK